jgi:hypothetical protein
MSPERPWYDLTDFPGVNVQVDDVGGRTRIVGVQIQRPEGVTADDLRSVPVHRLEAALAALGADKHPGVDPGDLTTRYSKSPPGGSLRIPERLFARDRNRYPNRFYERVAGLYSWCVANGVAPAPAIAEANRTPVASVRRWFAEARRRGLLAPARMPGGEG